MNLDDFRKWLVAHKGHASRAAGDVVSRSKRIERILGKPIQDLVRSEAALVKTLGLLSSKADEYLPSNVCQDSSVYALRRAAVLAREFVESK
jgi:hypothetical protein